MMFDYRHYVPILRWKRAEWRALQNMYEVDKGGITPLIELTPKDFASRSPRTTTDVNKILSQKTNEICENWGRATFFVDLWLLPPSLRLVNGVHPLVALGNEARTRQLSLIPVTGLKRDKEYHSAVASVVTMDRKGACVRVFLDDIRQTSFQNNLESLLSYLRLQPEQIDLLVDYQFISDFSPSFAYICMHLPHLLRWRTLTIASGAFPKDLSELEKNSQHVLQRLDWLTWLGQVTNEATLPRKPSYSDYTIQHPIFSEPPEFPNFSASIRYTSNEYWVIMRGEGVFNDNGPGYAQWPANALLLSERAEFCGANFCYGDGYIAERSLQPDKTRNPETWLRAGINHHMTFVVRQIASLFGISFVAAPSSGASPKRQPQRAVHKSRRAA